ncbi:hypothetical protein ACRAWD_03830 [Caulobacter segnis]
MVAASGLALALAAPASARAGRGACGPSTPVPVERIQAAYGVTLDPDVAGRGQASGRVRLTNGCSAGLVIAPRELAVTSRALHVAAGAQALSDDEATTTSGTAS